MSITDGLITTGPSSRGWHLRGQAVQCLRKHGYAWEAQREARKEIVDPYEYCQGKPALIKGELMHLGLAHWYARRAILQHGVCYVDRTKVENVNDICPPLEAIERLCQLRGWGTGYSIVGGALEAYMDSFVYDTTFGQVVAVEFEMQAWLPNQDGKLRDGRDRYTQRADMLCKIGEQMYIVDHKTVYAILTKTMDQFCMDGQFLGYHALGEERWGANFGGVWVNRICLSGPKFDKAMIRKSHIATAQHLNNMRLWELEMQEWEDSGLAPDYWPGSTSEHICYGKYGACEYLSRCMYGI